MLPGWLRVRLIDESYAQARSLTTSFLMYLLAKAFVIDQRMIISSSMQPTIAVGDRVLVDKASIVFGRLPGRRVELRRNDMIVFRPPEACRLLFEEMSSSSSSSSSIGGNSGPSSWMAWMARKRCHWNKHCPSNKPYLSDFTKRVVALSGDRVAVRRGLLYINNQAANNATGAIQAPRRTLNGRFWQGNEKYQHVVKCRYSLATTLVPEGHVWVLGDKRDASFDSHIWGPLPINNVVGRIRGRYWPIHRVAWFRRDSA